MIAGYDWAWCTRKVLEIFFRMSRDTSSDLNVELHHLLHRETPNYRSFTTENKLAITLYYLKDTGSLWMTESFFGIRQCTTSKTMRTVFEAIKSVLGQKYLHLPRTTTEMQKKGFIIWGEVWHDSSLWMYWWYMYPSKNSSCKLTRLFNYKQYFPHLQAICDSTVQAIYDRKGYFMDVECKWLGSVHDMKGFANSVVCKNIRSNNLPQRSYNILSGYESLSNYIVGYPSYPVTPYCIMKKIQYWVENKQVIFNNMLRRARNQI